MNDSGQVLHCLFQPHLTLTKTYRSQSTGFGEPGQIIGTVKQVACIRRRDSYLRFQFEHLGERGDYLHQWQAFVAGDIQDKRFI